MGEFEFLRDRLRDVRTRLEASAADVRLVEDRLARLDAEDAELSRVFNPGVPGHAAARQRLQEERGRAIAARTAASLRRKEAVQDEATLREMFGRLSDPRAELPRLNDDTPILLMPVRVETRFKTVFIPGPVPGHHQLLVRIYPDDCWIDTFNPALSDAEAASARAFWTAMWQAGGGEAQERAAWRSVARAHGSGRARWIVGTLKPANPGRQPSKTRADDVILVIVADAEPPAAEAAAIAAFWQEAWKSAGDARRLAAARAALAGAVGDTRAGEIIARLQPDNFDVTPANGADRDAIGVSAAFLVFEPVPAAREGWAGAPRVTLFPDRFVVIGYRNDEAPVVAIGRPVASAVITGPDPSAPADQQLRLDGSGNLVFPSDLAWIADYGKAVEIGLGVTLGLTPAQRHTGFDRLLVLGVRLSADAQTAQGELETLLRHHGVSRAGLSLLPQGTPTNNTEAVNAGAGTIDDADASFDVWRTAQFVTTSKWFDKADGQWLAEALGVDASVFAHARHAGGSDQSVERAMNMAMWPATFGYWMGSMMAPVFPPAAIDLTRTLFTRYVVGSGAVPALRIGAQPYGIVPATAFARMKWAAPAAGDTGDPLNAFAARIHPVLRALEREWRSLLDQVSYTGKPAADPHQVLLDILGLHPGSVEWSSRDAESRMTIFNRLNLQGVGIAMGQIGSATQWVNAREQLTRLGYQGSPAPIVLDYLFSGSQLLLKGGVVDDRPLSEVDGLRPCTTGGANYIEWLIDAASASLERLYAQDDFADDRPPAALLYLLLRYALQLGYYDASIRLHEQAGLLTPAGAAAARVDQPILHVSAASRVSESRYQPLFSVRPEIAGPGSQATVAEVIASRMPQLPPASHLREQIAALERLKRQPTAPLERAFADHVDCCSYRLDAWTLSLVNHRLATMRGTGEADRGPQRPGIYLGAYGWLEDVRPRDGAFSSPPPVEFDDPSVAADFAAPDGVPLVRAAGNQGYVHAPSLNQAVAAAVLRNGYISNASPGIRDTLAVNLTSERVRTALWLIDGIRSGQGLSDLLGYQFERGLHDRHGDVEIDRFIYALRKAFPLRGDHLQSTATPEGVAIESIEARNVIDGLALANHIKTGMHHYPFEKEGLPPASLAEAVAIDREAERLLASYDAVADLALAEGVYQAVLGNYDRAAANYDAYARADAPPQPDIVRTPTSAFGMTHRVALHLQAGADPSRSPDPALAMTPRAQAEPALNAWFFALLPPLRSIGCVVSFRDAAQGATAEREITLDRVGLQPADLVAVAGGSPDGLRELDDRLADLAAGFGARPDVPVTIRYMESRDAALSVFEVLPLLRALKTLTAGTRPLRPSDLSLPSEARSNQDASPVLDRARIARVEAAMRGLAEDAAAFVARADAAPADPAARRAHLLAAIDTMAAGADALLSRAALFGIPQTGREFVRDFRRRLFAGVLAQAAELTARWTRQLALFDAGIAEHDRQAPAATVERFQLLSAAAARISTRPIVPPPASPGELRARLVDVARPAFAARLDAFAGLQRTTRTRVADLIGDIDALLPIEAFDATPLDLAAPEQAIDAFAAEARSAAAALGAILARRLADAAAQFAIHDASAIALDRTAALEAAAKALLGDDVVLVPEFTVADAQREEFGNALAASRSGAPFEHLVRPSGPRATPIDFPLDTWLHGIARVRERLHAWEQTAMLAGALAGTEPALDALQLPHVPGDRWLGLDIPADQALDADRLLYTAHLAAPPDAAGRVCGLLLDEWTETIPASELDTGIALHFDRPNAEAPQAMLLVVPPEFRGAWQWDDLVDAVLETIDAARRRAVEPAHLDRLPLAPFLPATIMANQVRELTIAVNLAANNQAATPGD